MKISKQLFMFALAGAALFGCSDSDNPAVTAGADVPAVSEKLYISVAELGEIKVIHLEEEAEGDTHQKIFRAVTPSDITATIKLRGRDGNPATVLPGDMVFSEGNAYIRLNSPGTGPLSTQIQMLDVATDGADHNHPIDVGERPTHLYLDPDKKVWILNDGDGAETAEADSASVIVGGTHRVIDDGDAATTGITVKLGSGHHLATFTTMSKRVFISNIHDNTVSVVDNDPASSNYLRTILNDGALPHNAAVMVGDNPHGIDYSHHMGGKIYNANTQDAVNAVSVIDENTLAQTFIPLGIGAGEIPAVSRLRTRHQHDDSSDGRFIYLLGQVEDDKGDSDPTNDETTGWVTVIDTMNTATDNGIIAKILIPHMRPARLIFGPHGKRLYIPSGVPFGGGVGTPDLEIDQLGVIDIDPTSPAFNTLLKKIKVGNAGGHGSVAVTTGDGHFLFVGNTGETTVSIINTEVLEVVKTIDVGGVPSGLGVVALESQGDGTGHGHT